MRPVQRLAVCVGINDYPGTGSDLSGCVNDALDWAALLAGRGYETVTLLDDQATKANLAAQLAAAVDRLRYRGRLVFTFSGHGTWVPDCDGDEIDGRDEALCCHEVWNGGILTDDELHAIFRRARHGTRITVLSDSCHSGTVARGLGTGAPLGLAPKFLSPGDLPTIPVSHAQAINAERRIAKATSRLGPVLISGCSDPEYSYDAWFDGRPNGAFTRAAIDALTPDVRTYREWHRRIRLRLPSPTYPQTPQLGATRHQARRRPLD